MSAPPEKFTELMTLCDENQETMNADKVRQVMEGIAAIKEQWPKPEDDSRGKISVKRIECDLNAGYNPNDPSFGMTVGGHDYYNLGRKRKFSMFIGEGDVANLHRMSGEYLETKRARRAERVVATCEGFSDATDGECHRRLLEGDPRAGWLRCEECGESFCCKRCAVDHSGVNPPLTCTGRCVSIA